MAKGMTRRSNAGVSWFRQQSALIRGAGVGCAAKTGASLFLSQCLAPSISTFSLLPTDQTLLLVIRDTALPLVSNYPSLELIIWRTAQLSVIPITCHLTRLMVHGIRSILYIQYGRTLTAIPANLVVNDLLYPGRPKNGHNNILSLLLPILLSSELFALRITGTVRAFGSMGKTAE
jgi:hypothetical protein